MCLIVHDERKMRRERAKYEQNEAGTEPLKAGMQVFRRA